MRLQALEAIKTKYPKEQWLQVCTDCLYMADCANKGTGVFYGIFPFYAPIGHIRSPFLGGRGVEAI